MFGRHKLTREGTATVVSSSDAAHSITRRSGGYHYSQFDLVLDVRTEDGTVFRTGATECFANLYQPSVGDRLRVRYNPESRDVSVDISHDARFNVKLHDAAQKARLEEQRRQDLAAPPGTAPSGQLDGRLDPELSELMRSEEEERGRSAG